MNELIVKFLNKVYNPTDCVVYEGTNFFVIIGDKKYSKDALLKHFEKVFDMEYMDLSMEVRGWFDKCLSEFFKPFERTLKTFSVELGDREWVFTNGENELTYDRMEIYLQTIHKTFPKTLCNHYLQQYYTHGQTEYFEDKKNQKKFGFFI